MTPTDKLSEAAALRAREPDYEAWQPAAQAFWQGAYPGHDTMHPVTEAEVVRGLIAALPLAPAEPVDDAWVEATARAMFKEYGGYHDTYEMIEEVVRATLQRGARWPGEAELRELRQALVNHNDALRSAHAVAARKGADTNWATLSPRIGSVLSFHHDTVNAARNALLEDASDRILGAAS
jgi:hypothetical protein